MSLSAAPASSISQALRRVERTLATYFFGHRSTTFARLMHLTALNWRRPAKRRLDGLGQRLGAIEDEQTWDPRIQAARYKIVEQRLNRNSILGSAFDKSENVLSAVGVDADRPNQNNVLGHVQAVDLNDEQIQLGEVAGKPGFHVLLRQRHKPA